MMRRSALIPRSGNTNRNVRWEDPNALLSCRSRVAGDQFGIHKPDFFSRRITHHWKTPSEHASKSRSKEAGPFKTSVRTDRL